MLPAWRAAALFDRSEDTHMPTLTMLYLMCTWLYLCGFEALLCWWVITLVELCGPTEVMLCTFMIQTDIISASFGLFLIFFLAFLCLLLNLVSLHHKRSLYKIWCQLSPVHLFCEQQTSDGIFALTSESEIKTPFEISVLINLSWWSWLNSGIRKRLV